MYDTELYPALDVPTRAEQSTGARTASRCPHYVREWLCSPKAHKISYRLPCKRYESHSAAVDTESNIVLRGGIQTPRGRAQRTNREYPNTKRTTPGLPRSTGVEPAPVALPTRRAHDCATRFGYVRGLLLHATLQPCAASPRPRPHWHAPPAPRPILPGRGAVGGLTPSPAAVSGAACGHTPSSASSGRGAAGTRLFADSSERGERQSVEPQWWRCRPRHRALPRG